MTQQGINAFAAASNSLGGGIIGKAGVILFMVAFALVLVYVFLPKNRESFDRASQMPLEKDPDEDMQRGHYGR
jgi:cbb3-type cytochrome oxidase subunit 3